MELYRDQAENEFTIALANGDVLKVNNGSIYALDKDEFVDKAVATGDKADEIDRLSLKGYWNRESETMTLPENADADDIVIGNLAERRN